MTQSNKSPIFAIVAGEHSGDNYGAMIIRSIKQRYPDATFIGVGGDKMQGEGLKPLMPMDVLSVIGFVAVIKNIFQLLKAKRQLIKDILSYKPDCYIGIDAPDFNLRVARAIKKHAFKNNLSTKTIQYISPTVWAWRPKRIYTVAKATDLVLCIFPFEEKIYSDQNIPAKFIGHPLTQILQPRSFTDKQVSIEKIAQINNNISTDSNLKTIGIFPGSRVSEINSLAPIFLQTVDCLQQKKINCQFVVPMVSEKLYHLWLQHCQEVTNSDIVRDKIHVIKLYETSALTSIDVMKATDLILSASGTTTIEAMLLNIPMVVAYKVSKLNELLFKLLIKIRYLAMPNILSDKLLGIKLVPEFLQADVTVDNLCLAVIEELKKYSHHSTDENWHTLQQYLLADSIDHPGAIRNAVLDLLKI